MNDNVDWKNVVPNQIQSLYCKPHTTVEDTFFYQTPINYTTKREPSFYLHNK